MGEKEEKTGLEKLNHDCYWCACDWHGNQIWALDIWEPCCGSPCNVLDGLKCCCCWTFCCTCTLAKMYAYSHDQDCACMNHFALACLLPCAVSVITRHNLRRKENVGDVCEYWWGDCLCVCCCGWCTICQMARATKIDDWDWLHGVQTKGFPFCEEPCKFWLPD